MLNIKVSRKYTTLKNINLTFFKKPYLTKLKKYNLGLLNLTSVESFSQSLLRISKVPNFFSKIYLIRFGG